LAKKRFPVPRHPKTSQFEAGSRQKPPFPQTPTAGTKPEHFCCSRNTFTKGDFFDRITAMEFTMFYAWQSDRPNSVNRRFIQDAAEAAIKALNASATLDLSPRLDQDTKDIPGMPDIAKTILDKIDSCGVFLADLTFVGSTEKSKDAAKLIPNPNVLIELGWAMKTVGWDRIICVMNTQYGQPNLLPFDLQHRRHPIQFVAIPDRDNSDAKKGLAKDIQLALKSIIESGALNDLGSTRKSPRNLDDLLIMLEPLVDQAVERRLANEQKKSEMPSEEVVPAFVQQERQRFEAQVKEGKFYGLRKTNEGIIALSIIPNKPLPAPLGLSGVRGVDLRPIYCSGWNHGFRGHSFVTEDTWKDEPRHAITELTDKGIIKAADTLVLDAKKYFSQQISNERVKGIVASIAYEKEIVLSVTEYSKLLANLQVPTPYCIGISLLNVHGYIMYVDLQYRHLGRILDQDDIVADAVAISDVNKDTQPETVAKLLKPAFDQIWREFNFPRSFNFDKDGNWAPRA